MSAKQDTITSSGIVTDTSTGQRHVPVSTRADGSQRREIRIRPGYRPPEDVEVYRNKSAQAWKNRGSTAIPGAEGLSSENSSLKSGTAASNKNAKRREARKKVKVGSAGDDDAGDHDQHEAAATTPQPEPVAAVDPEAEKEKKARNFKKKLRQARDLRDKKDKGESLLPEQLEKVIKINELIRQLDALGFDADGEMKAR